jgi:pimeloyl-ACP methyl ester carboxylesterase
MPEMPEPWVREGLATVQAPALCLTGRYDFLTPPDAAYEVYSALPRARLHVVDHAGHNAWIERPAAVGGALRQFLADIE